MKLEDGVITLWEVHNKENRKGTVNGEAVLPEDKTMYGRYIKRPLDVIFSFILLVILSPLFLLIMAAVCLDSKGGPFFRQQRIGKNEKIFNILKFRSMTVNTEHTGSGAYSNDTDPRVTRIGRILRRNSLDELPQFINILRGEMSFIGPRPPLTYHPWPIEQYTEKQRRMFTVRPGITGWAQVNGRRSIDWNERIRLNNYYIEHLTFGMDCRIVMMTIKAVLKNDNNANIGIVTPPEPKD